MDVENQYGTLEIQKGLLQLLKSFDDLCIRHGIHYSVSSGTMLGAIRHQGFIPWDDDVDVTIERAYYDKLMEAIKDSSILLCEKRLWLNRVRFKDKEASRVGNCYPTIDVFTWDHVPDNKIQERMKFYLIAFLQGMIKGRPEYERFSFFYKIISFILYMIGRLFPLSLKLSIYSWVAQLGNGTESKYHGGYFDQFNALKFRYDKDLLYPLERRKFEDIEVNVMSKYDKYLKIIYGEHYMTPPQENSRKPTHQ